MSRKTEVTRRNPVAKALAVVGRGRYVPDKRHAERDRRARREQRAPYDQPAVARGLVMGSGQRVLCGQGERTQGAGQARPWGTLNVRNS